MGKVQKRLNFSKRTKNLIFGKVDGKCSVPRCKNPAMGPHINSEGSVNMGVACHIHSAAKNGPRGWGHKDQDFIESEANGIWCCAYHAELIDKNKGDDYTPDTLFSWKKLAEAKVIKRMNDVPSPLGWVDSIMITEFPLENIAPKVSLSRFTLIYGDNCVGKSVLLELTSCISNSKCAERFMNNKYSFTGKVNYSTVDSYSKELEIKINNTELYRYENNLKTLLPPGDLEIIFCSEKDLRHEEHEDDIDFFMRILNVDKCALFTLIEQGTTLLHPGKMKFEIGKTGELDDDGYFDEEERRKINEEPYYELNFINSKRSRYYPFSSLSSSEKNLIILELLIIKAREVCKQRLTLLMIEDLVKFDITFFEKLSNILQNEDFQVVMTLPYRIDHMLLDKEEDNYKLKDLDYLKHWNLKIIKENKV